MATNDTPNPHPHGHKGRDGGGRYTKSLEGAERDAHAARLHANGASYNEIATELGIHKSQAIRAVQRAVRAVVKDAGEEVLKLHLSRMEYLYEKAVEVIEADHVIVSHGKVVCDADGNPLRDHAPVLAAINAGRQCLESVQTLIGIKKPAKVEHSGGVKYELVGVNPEDVA